MVKEATSLNLKSQDLNLIDRIPKNLLSLLITDETRFRLYDPVTTLYLFGQQILRKLSCREVLASFNLKLRSNPNKIRSLNTGSYCRAKAKLDEEILKKIALNLSENEDREERVFIVDGTTMQAEDTLVNQVFYPQNPKQKKGLGQPILRLVFVFNALTGKIVNYESESYMGKGSAEPSLFRRMMDSFRIGDIIICDRFYSGFGLCKEMKERKIDFVVRGRDRFVKDRLKKFLDRELEVIDPSKRSNHRLKLRFLKHKLKKNGYRDKDLYLITSLKEKSKEEIASLYLKRWQGEVNLRDLKRTVGAYFIRSKSPSMIRKEIAVNVMIYNLTRGMIVNCSFDCLKKSFKLSKFLLSELLNRCTQNKILIKELLNSVILNSKFRSEVRAIKRRNKGSYGYLMRPRWEFKAPNAVA